MFLVVKFNGQIHDGGRYLTSRGRKVSVEIEVIVQVEGTDLRRSIRFKHVLSQD